MKTQSIIALGAALLLFFSVKAADGADTPSTDDGPSFSETLKWINSKKGVFEAAFDVNGNGQDDVVWIVRLTGSDNTVTFLWREYQYQSAGSVGNLFIRCRSCLREVTIPMDTLYADIEIGNHRRVGVYGANEYRANEYLPLIILAKSASIKVRKWEAEKTYETGTGTTYYLNKKAVTRNALPLDEETLFDGTKVFSMTDVQVESWMKSASAVDSTTDKQFIYVEKPSAERMKKALEHLIKLAGGGGKEPF